MAKWGSSGASSKGSKWGGGSASTSLPSGGSSDSGSFLTKALRAIGRSPVGKALEVLDLPRAALLSTGVEVAERVTGSDFGLGDFDDRIKSHVGVGDLVKDAPLPLNVKRALGFVGDVATDPLTYLTAGASVAAKGGGKAVRLSTKQAATALERAGLEEATDRVLRRGVSAATSQELAEAGIEYGARFAGRRVRSADPIAQALGRLSQPIRETVTDSAFGGAVRSKVGGRMGEVTTELRKLPGGARAALLVENADKRARAESKGIRQKGESALGTVVKRNPDLDLDEVRRVLEGGAGNSRAATQLRAILDGMRAEAESLTGRRIPTVDHYLPHRLSDEAKDALSKKGGGRPSKKVAAELRRAYKAGDEFMGVTLKTGSIDEINSIAEKTIGPLFKDNPVELVRTYVGEMARFVERYGRVKHLGDMAGAVDAVMKTIPVKGAKKAGKKADELEPKLQAIIAKAQKQEASAATARTAAASEQGSAAAAAQAAAATAQRGAKAGSIADQLDSRIAYQAAQADRLTNEQLDAFGRGTTFDGPRAGNRRAVKAANDYIARHAAELGADATRPLNLNVRVDDGFMRRIAAAYDELPESAVEARAAYEALGRETERQFNYMTKELGIKVEFVDADPYADAAEMMADVMNNGRLKVLKTDPAQPHPFLTNEQNDKFRAIHDFFGHAAHGGRFDRHGEELAFQAHSRMFSPEARRAMATETRGQNAWLNYSPENVARRARGEQPQFPTQKMALLPDEFTGLPQDRPSSPTKPTASDHARARKLRDELAQNEALMAQVRQAGSNLSASTKGAADTSFVLDRVRQRLQGLEAERARLIAEAEELRARIKGQTATPQEAAAAVADARLKAAESVAEGADDFDAAAAAAFDDAAEQVEVLSSRIEQLQNEITVAKGRAAAKRQAERELLEEARSLHDAAVRHAAAGQAELAKVARLEAWAAKNRAKADEWQKAYDAFRQTQVSKKAIVDAKAMAQRSLVELADGRYAETWVADALRQVEETFTQESIGRFLKTFDWFTSRWRAYALLSPGYHGRNLLGGAFNNHLAGMRPTAYVTYAKAAKQAKDAAKKAGRVGWDTRAITDPKVREAFELMARFGVLDGSDVLDLGDLVTTQSPTVGLLGKKARKVDPTSTENVVLSANNRTARKVERELRGPLFIDTYLKTGDAELALDMVARYHFDYTDLSVFETRFLKRVTGFYTWTRKNLPLQLAHMATRPGAYTAYTHAKRNLELGVPEDETVPSYYGELLAIRLPFSVDGNRIYATPDLPFIGLSKTLDPMQAASSLNPLLKVPVESSTNFKLFEQRPFSPGIRETPEWWAPVLHVLRAANGRLGLPKVYVAADGQLMMSEKDANKIESLSPVLGRLRRLAPSEKKYQDRIFTTWMSFVFGLGGRTLDEASVKGELFRRQKEQQEKDRIRKTLNEGR